MERPAFGLGTVKEIDRITYVGKLLALIQLYLELNLTVTDAILAAESDLVTWKVLDRASRCRYSILDHKKEKYRSTDSLQVHGQDRTT